MIKLKGRNLGGTSRCGSSARRRLSSREPQAKQGQRCGIIAMCMGGVGGQKRFWSQVGAMLESSEASWAADGRRAYHAFSRGWIANELFRRVHPEGATIGNFIREKIFKSFGARVLVGVNDGEIDDYAPVAEVIKDDSHDNFHSHSHHTWKTS